MADVSPRAAAVRGSIDSAKSFMQVLRRIEAEAASPISAPVARSFSAPAGQLMQQRARSQSGAASPPPLEQTEVAELLRDLQLDGYCRAFAIEGYDLISDLEGLTALELSAELGMRRGHARRLVRHLSDSQCGVQGQPARLRLGRASVSLRPFAVTPVDTHSSTQPAVVADGVAGCGGRRSRQCAHGPAEN